jgi:hypothetical protein
VRSQIEQVLRPIDPESFFEREQKVRKKLRFFQYALEVRGSNSAPVADRNRFVNFVSFCGIHGSKSKRSA